MSVLVVIPARYASSRFPGKPLVGLSGATGTSQTLIERSWRAARSVSGVDRVVIATDDDRITEHAAGFGAEVVATSSDCRNGTERCAEAVARIGGAFDIVVNFQGDAPLTPPWFVEDLVKALAAQPGFAMATPVLQTDGAALAKLREDRKSGRVGGTTAVFGKSGRALFFSKEVIPFADPDYADDAMTPVWHHVGVYAYRPDALARYATWGEGRLERLEGLEQLRFLEEGADVLCVPVAARGREFWELNNPEDVPRLEAMMRRMGIE